MVTVVVELNRIPINDDISISKQVHRDLIDEIRIFVLHEFSVCLDNYINPTVLFLFVRAIFDDRLGFSQTYNGEAFWVDPFFNEGPLDCVCTPHTYISVDARISQGTRVDLNSDGVTAEITST